MVSFKDFVLNKILLHLAFLTTITPHHHNHIFMGTSTYVKVRFITGKKSLVLQMTDLPQKEDKL